MKCPICGNTLMQYADVDLQGNPRYNYYCDAEACPHFMTNSYATLEEATMEVELTTKKYEEEKKKGCWRRINNEVSCSHCGTVINVCKSEESYRKIVSTNKFCRFCGMSMEGETRKVPVKLEVPENLTVQDYNKNWIKTHLHAESFVKLLDSAIEKSGSYEAVMKQLECIGWPDVKSTLLLSIEIYKDVLLSKIKGWSSKSKYRHITLCGDCKNCLTICDEGCVCKYSGIMPVDGFCSRGAPKEDRTIMQKDLV